MVVDATMALVVSSVVALVAVAWDIGKSVYKDSSGMKKKHSDLVRKLKTLRALRVDLKSRATKNRSANEHTMNDWFHRVMDVEKRAQKLLNKIEEKQGYVYVVTRFKLNRVTRYMLNRRMAKMILEISELVTDGIMLCGESNLISVECLFWVAAIWVAAIWAANITIWP